MEPKNVLQEYQRSLRGSLDALSGWRTNAIKDFQMYAGNQWDKPDVDKLRGTQREGIVFNKITGVVNAVCGSEVTNRFETRYIPRTTDDEFFNEVMTEVVRYIRQRADIEHEESGAFMDAAICGVGCTEFWKDYSEDAEGIDKVDRVTPMDLLWDPSAKKMNLDDGRYVIRGKWISLEEAKARWPEKKQLLDTMASAKDGAAYPNEGEGGAHDQSEAFKYSQDELSFYNAAQDKVLIHEFQRWYMVPRYFFVNPVDGREMLVSQEEWRGIKELFKEQGIPEPEHAVNPMKEYWRGYFTGDTVLSDRKAPVQSGFTYRFITGFRDTREDKVMWFGLVKLMRDPQRWLNKAMSQIIYIMSTNPKGAILAEKGTFVNPTQAARDWGLPNKVIDMQPGAVANKQFTIAKGEYPTGLDRIMQISTQFVTESVGVNPYFMGNVDDLRRTAGSAVTSVQQQALVVLSVLFDSLKKYRRGAGRMHLEFIEKFMQEGTIVRITIPGAGQAQPIAIPFKQDWVQKVKYDIIVDSAPVSHNAIREFWQSLQQTQSLELLMNAGIMTADIIADTVPDVPTTIRERMKMNAMKQDLLGQAMQMLQQGNEQGVLDMLYQIMEQQGQGGGLR